MDSKINLIRNKQILTQGLRCVKKYKEKYGDVPIVPSKMECVVEELISKEAAKLVTEKGDE